MMHSILLFFARLAIHAIATGREYINSAFQYKLRSRLKQSDATLRIDISSTFKGEKYMEFGRNFRSGRRNRFYCWSTYMSQHFSPALKIGSDFYCGTNCYFSCIKGINIGHHVTLANNITIIDHNHGKADFSDLEVPVLERELSSKGPITIEDNVWLAEGVIVLGGGKNRKEQHHWGRQCGYARHSSQLHCGWKSCKSVAPG